MGIIILILLLAQGHDIGGQKTQCGLGTSHKSVQLSLTKGKKFGDNLQLECVYASTPNATIIVWSFNNKLLSILNGTNVTDFEQNISGNISSTTKSTLFIENANEQHTGIYHCAVQHNETFQSYVTSTAVLLIPEKVIVKINASTELNCSSQRSVTWLKDGIPLQNQTGYVNMTNNILYLQNITSGNLGNYSCFIDNLKFRSYSVKLEEVPPVPEEEKKLGTAGYALGICILIVVTGSLLFAIGLQRKNCCERKPT